MTPRPAWMNTWMNLTMVNVKLCRLANAEKVSSLQLVPARSAVECTRKRSVKMGVRSLKSDTCAASSDAGERRQRSAVKMGVSSLKPVPTRASEAGDNSIHDATAAKAAQKEKVNKKNVAQLFDPVRSMFARAGRSIRGQMREVRRRLARG